MQGCRSCFKAFYLIWLQVKEEKSRRFFGDSVIDFVVKVGLDQHDNNEGGKAQSKGKKGASRWRSATVNVGQTEAQ